MAESTLRPGQLSGGDRYQVVVHVTADTLADDDTDGRIRFTRSDSRVINNHPRLPGGTIAALRCGNEQDNQAIDVSSWIIPHDDLDYDIAIGGLLSLQQKRLPTETITA